MSVPLIINGVTFNYPQQGDVNWGPTLTNWSTAVTNALTPLHGGTLTLTSDLNFGSSFGLIAAYYKSAETNIATAGIVRLANASTGIVWRNALNTGNLPLTVNAGNQLTFNGTPIGASATLTDSHIFVGNASNQPTDVAMSGDTTITNTGVVTIANNAITNVKVAAAAAIALTKLAATTASRAIVSDGSGFLVPSTTTAAEIGFVNGVTSAIQTQLNTLTSNQANYLPLAGGTMSGAINMASHKIISLTAGTNTGEALSYGQDVADPTTAQQIATKNYADTSTAVGTGRVSALTTQTLTVSAGFGVAVNKFFFTRRVGDCLEGEFYFTAGTVAASLASITVPMGLSVDLTKVPGNAKNFVGIAGVSSGAGGAGVFTNAVGFILILTSADTTQIYFTQVNGTDASGSTFGAAVNGNAMSNNGGSVTGRFTVPILGWT